jgi:hypothetical protein
MIQQIYFPYFLWEDWKYGMWRNIYGKEREDLLMRAIEFTGDYKLYGSYMLKVLDKMPYGCLVNLTNPAINHQAWIGHAACCLAINCPEDITRLAWHQLTQKQQDDANLEADKAIAKFNRQLETGVQLCQSLV